MKRIIAGALALLMISLLGACGKTEPTPTEPATQPPVFTEEVAVTDGFADTVEGCCFHIPRISLGDISVEEANSYIYEELNYLLQEGVYHCVEDGYSLWYTGMVYEWVQTEKVLSVVVQVKSAANDVTEYYVYNISVESGELLSDLALYEELSISESAGKQILQEACELYWDNFVAEHGDSQDPDFLQQLREQTLSEENLAQVKPYANKDGAVGYVVNIYSVAGAPYYEYRIERSGVLPEMQCKEHTK